MKPTPLADVAEHPADAIIYSLVGTLKMVHDRKSGKISKGPNQGNPWSLQNLVITDGTTDVQVVLKDREDEIPKSWKNRDVMFEAHQGQKGWSGVYAYDDDYNGQVTRKVKVTATGQVSLVGEAPHQQQQAPPKTQQQQQPPRNQQTAEKTAETDVEAKAADERKRLREAVAKATQIANLQLLCLNKVSGYVAERFQAKTGRELTVQEIHALSMNMCIEMMRGGAHWTMPAHEIEDPKPPTK